jgi:abhydrolase domain-containing protein 6
VTGLAIAIAIVVVLLGSYYLFPLQWAPLLMALERISSGLKTKRITIDGRTFTYLEGGRGPDVVMLHGFGASSDHWTRMARALGKRYHLVAPDLPGFGRTTAEQSERFMIPLQAERLHKFLQAMGLKRYHVVANSMGGNVAGVLANTHPEEIQSLTLMEPQGIQSRTLSVADLQIQQGKRPLVPATAEEFDYLVNLVFVKKPFIPRAVLSFLRKQSLAIEPLHRVIWNDLWHPDYPYHLEKNLPGIRAPTLVIWGDSDRLLHVTALEKIEQHVRDVRVIKLKACGHTAMIERPGEVAQHFEAFIASLRTSVVSDKVLAPQAT